MPLAAASLFILKVFFIPGCFAFDSNDDANLTFPSLGVARSILRQGEIPLMNVFNNFGTPLLGDVVTYPFSLQALTYYFLPDHLAMTVNRFIIIFLSIIFLTIYLRRYVSAFSATLCALLAVFMPWVAWGVIHHHYQMFLLFFVLLLFLQERFAKTKRLFDLLLFYFTFVGMILSVNINPVLLAVPFLLVNQFFLSGLRGDKALFLVSAALISGFLFNYPDLVSFVVATAQSARRWEEYGNPYSLTRLLSGLVGQTQPWRLSQDAFIYWSFPVLALAGLGVASLWRKQTTRFLALRVFTLGIVPILLGFLLLYFRDFTWSIPLVKSTDITRIWWPANIFVGITLGSALDTLRKEEWPWRNFNFLAAVVTGVVSILVCGRWVAWRDIDMDYKLALLSFLALILTYTCLRADFFSSGLSGRIRKIRERIATRGVSVLIAIALIAAQLPSVLRILGLNSWATCAASKHHFSNIGEATFTPLSLLNQMEPYSRLATGEHTFLGHDARAAKAQIFGSGARQALVAKPFTGFLVKEDMIEIEQSPVAYHFKRPWNKEKLSRLGIRYVLQKGRNPDLEAQQWRFVAEDSSYFLYENPDDVGLAYWLKDGQRVFLDPDDILVRGNGLSLKLPAAAGRELVVTLVDSLGWKAWVDGKKTEIFHREDQLIRIKLRSGDQKLLVRYQPFQGYHFLAGMISSLLLVTAAYHGSHAVVIRPLEARIGG